MAKPQTLSLEEALKLAEKVQKWEHPTTGSWDVKVRDSYAGKIDKMAILLEGPSMTYSLLDIILPWRKGTKMRVLASGESDSWSIVLGDYRNSRIKPTYVKAKQYMDAQEEKQLTESISQARNLARF